MARKSPFLYVALFFALGIFLTLSGCTMPVTIEIHPPGDEAGTCGSSMQALVTRVIDGDTIMVQYPGGREETVRILGIDTPETEDHGNWGNEYEGISDPAYLTSWGLRASEYTRSLLAGRNITLTGDCQAGERDRYGRLLAYVSRDGTDVGAMLIREGYARIYAEESFGKKASYLPLQRDAQAAGAGLWRAAEVTKTSPDGPVSIAAVQYDAPGDDRENLNGEYIALASREVVNLSGWTVADNSGTVYTFHDVVIRPGATITLHIGSGIPTGTDLYWNLSVPLLGNDSDAVTLRDPSRNVVATMQWGI
ncbi:MAG: thermonuclease family protein [Methanolinea sp.]|jgi:micrococcal nuclease|nr:thermonuclease family protein [Methanolinea sp.]